MINKKCIFCQIEHNVVHVVDAMPIWIFCAWLLWLKWIIPIMTLIATLHMWLQCYLNLMLLLMLLIYVY